MKRLGLASVLMLAACAAPRGAQAPIPYVPDGNGIALAGSPLRIDFGRSQSGAIAAAARLEGRQPSATTDCAGGVTAVTWPDGLSLHFRDEVFLGWRRADGTAAGIACGA